MWKWFLILVVLFVVLEWWNRRSAKRGARRLVEMSKALYSGAHEYRETSLASYPHVDARFYVDTSDRLRKNGFTFLGDIEDVTSSQTGPVKPTPIRVMIGDGGTISAGLYHGIVGGLFGVIFALLGKRSFRIVDLETALSDGRFIVTSNAQVAGGLDSPPEIEGEYLPVNTPLDALLERHRHKVESNLAGAPEVRPLTFSTLREVLEHQERLDEIKSQFRKARGNRFTADEMTRVSGKAYRSASEDLAKEMSKLE